MDRSDARILLALVEDPRSTVVSLAERLTMSRNTVQARLTRLWDGGALSSLEQSINPASIGYPMTAFVLITVVQRQLDRVAANLELIPEVLEVLGISGSVDMMARVVAKDANDLYRIAGCILAVDGVERTETALVMREMVEYRVAPLLRRIATPDRP